MSKANREEILNKYGSLFMSVDTNIDIDSVILSSENKLKIKEFLREYNSRSELREYGLKPMNRLLMYGDSGTGKTFLTKALSNYMKYTMLYVDIAKSLSEDTVAQNISDIFECANNLKDCIVFFDECDSIAWNRDAKTAEGGTVRRAVNSLFQQLDQFDSSNVFVAATNMLRRLDPAFERRFDMKLEFRKASGGLVDIIKKFMFDKFILSEDVGSSQLALMDRRVSLSYYEIQIIVERNMKKAILNKNPKLHNKVAVRLSDVFDDLAVHMQIKTRFGTNKSSEDTFESNLSTYKFG
jgi:peroxisomal ATPase pex6